VKRDRRAIPLEPRTNVGQWLKATLLKRPEIARKLTRSLNNGIQGWNEDEPAVVAAAAEIAVHRFVFPDEASQVRFVDDIVSGGSASAVDAAELLAVLQEVLGVLPVSGEISPLVRYRDHAVLVAQAQRILVLTDRDIAHLIVSAENEAFRRGYNPPLHRSTLHST